MGTVIEFARLRRKPKAGPWSRSRAKKPTGAGRRTSWLQAAKWLPLGFVIGAAAGLALIAVEPRAPAFLAGGAEAHDARFNASGDFRPCGAFPLRDCVIDGDTIRYGGVKVRLADIDAPEIFSPKCASEAALGRRATERLAELMSAGPFEVVRAGGRDEDVYGRKLRLVERNGRSLADALVAEGLARRWDGARRGWCG